MKRKHMPGCYCCQEACLELLPQNLPCIEPPSGFELVFDWMGPECCKCITWGKVQIDPYQCTDAGFLRQTATFEQNWLALELPPPPIVCDGNCESLKTQGAYYCCASDVFVAATSETNAESTVQLVVAIRKESESIQLCLKKGIVTCNDVEETKFIVHLTYRRDYTYRYGVRRKTNALTRTFSNVATCFSINEEDLRQECDCNADWTWDINRECEEIPFFDSQGKAVTAIFNYILFIDEADWPPDPGDLLVFDNTSKPGACDYTICNDLKNFDDEICLAISSWPTEIKPCWCNATFTCTTEVFPVGLNVLCGNPTILLGCECDPEIPPITGVCGSFDPYVCGTYNINCFVCTVTNLDSGTDCFSGLPNTTGSEIQQWFSGLFTFSCANEITDPYRNSPTCGNANYCAIPQICTGRAPCGSCCLEYGDCQCAPKYSPFAVELTSYDHEFECTWTPWSFCIQRPTITLTIQEC